MLSSAAASARAVAITTRKNTVNFHSGGCGQYGAHPLISKEKRLSVTENFIIIAIVVCVAVIGVYSAVKHFKGKGGCCGGGDYRPKKKKLSNVIYQKTFTVAGMHCEHCKNRVEEVVNDINGVAGRVDLKNGKLTVSYAEDVDDDLIKNRIQKAGYSVTTVK